MQVCLIYSELCKRNRPSRTQRLKKTDGYFAAELFRFENA